MAKLKSLYNIFMRTPGHIAFADRNRSWCSFLFWFC